MPNVFSKPALMEWALQYAPFVQQAVISYGKHRNTLRRSLWLLFLLRTAYTLHKAVDKFRREQKKTHTPKKPSINAPAEDQPKQEQKKKKADVDMAFLRQLQRLLKIVMPGMASKEFLMLVIHSGFLGKNH
ncbi:hypothetical protein BCR43DRAFT_305124 [Syncephalastrum racemosum]|uniref:Peroxisomal membrane protein PEX16 n=1 Tax=Syncephalastrum racemosum TaxID=13706 RepID=A0A1X2HA96_SYNRA|nr:hypothetical protein BCR43DRAFT_305124 [Syncephalastrum racemosum]